MRINVTGAALATLLVFSTGLKASAQGSTIHYGYRSEELDKSVSIAFQWGEPVQPVTDDGGAAQTQERSDE